MWSHSLVGLTISWLLLPLDCLHEDSWGNSLNAFVEHVKHDTRGGAAHHHHGPATPAPPPCRVCAGAARCVPRVQCPALLRAPHASPLCHLTAAHVGVCCATGHSHASESDRRQRAGSTVDAEALRGARRRSQERLAEWGRRERRLAGGGGAGGAGGAGRAVLPRSAPSYGHHMSTRTDEVEKANALGRGALENLFAAQELKQRQAVSSEQLSLGLPTTTDSPFCPPPPPCPPQPRRHRTADGTCNNAEHAGWGGARTAYERLLPPAYSDGTWAFRVSSAGSPLPSARAVSRAVLPDVDNPSATHNLLLPLFGQFLAHDVSAAVPFTLANGSAISCCAPDGTPLPAELQHAACSALELDDTDPFYSRFGHTCMNFVRTQLAPSHDCSLGYAKQMNGVTHYADLSPVYGSSEEKLATLREPAGGRLRVFTDFGRELPPLSTAPDDCLVQQDGAACFASGDDHVNQMISLVGLQTLWVREHNRLAAALEQLNPSWSPDFLFLEARRLLIAEYQHILYSEWLPLIVGWQTMEAFSLSPRPAGEHARDYRADVNPSVTSEFAAAALRFGHSAVGGKLAIPAAAATDAAQEHISIPEVMFQPGRMRLRHFLDRLLAGLSAQPMQTVDPFVTESLTQYMFHGGQPFGLDLAAINVQRGRDHGLRPYNDYRRLAGDEPFTDFSQLSAKAGERLSSVYTSLEDVELWVGGLLEPPLPDAAVGATFSNLLADQLSRMRSGDRYFYEHGADVNPGAFTTEQLAEIKKVTMARIVCDNSDGIELRAQAPHAFLQPHLSGNEPVPCDSPLIPSMDLSKFREV